MLHISYAQSAVNPAARRMKRRRMSNCIICGTREATIPDRNSGSSRKKLCHFCHAERLKGDIRHILAVEMKRRKKEVDDGDPEPLW